ncbi:hypothetical protein IWW38_003579 [Coemansia aciculifera]|uniref:Uncharacterized protein n=1 Tax=Coemansia aciculifera TaxID=417176 RepID=A0ACC1M091_9FUNG|nr:hypothetical protein IWW38_003579 [Coemansia aciculifera]
MASMVTLVDGFSATTTPSTNISAEARPGLLRDTANEDHHRQPDAADESLPPQNPPMARSQSEQTTALSSVSEESTDGNKLMHVGLARRVRESLKQRLRFIGAAIMLRHLHQSSIRGIDNYYAVSMA